VPPPALSSATYAVRLPLFEGPLDLLLHLIRAQKLDIRDIPIALVAEQYWAHLTLMEAAGTLDLSEAGEFLVMAATLMEIKSRMLLPRPAPIADEEDGLDPRAELVARLLEYERFQHVAEQLREMADATGRSFPRAVAESWEGGTPLVELRPVDLLTALRRLQPTEAENGAAPSLRVRRHGINLQRRMEEVVRVVVAAGRLVSFAGLAARGGRGSTRAEVLATFLAVLELVRLGRITAWQDGSQGIIYLGPPHPEPAENPEDTA
jgi:segregation and condensation protein A